MNNFNLLPPEIIEFIFNKLNSTDLINLRDVDKRFKKISEKIKIKQLCVSDKFGYYSLFWFYTNQPTYFNMKDSISFTEFPNYATIFQFDKHLKRLNLDMNPFNPFNLTILNQFKLLEQLSVKTYQLNDNYKLSLDYLKIVDFEIYSKDYNSDFKLTFDTIKLFALRLADFYLMNEVVFNYPDKILFIEINSSYDWQLYDNQLRNLNNLQYLKINNIKTDSIDRNILSHLKNLKIFDLSLRFSTNGYDDLFEDIKFLINEKENLRRSEFEIYLNGVKLINQNKLNQFQFSSDENEFDYNLLEFQIKNYDLLKDNCEINCDLIKLIKIIPSTFTNKFPFINQVCANDHIDNEEQFIKFLNNLPYLFRLKLKNCGLTKSFYDQLIDSVYLKDLKSLKIKDENDLGMNFDFILQLKQLRLFQTNQIIANHIDLIYKLFKQNQNIRSFIFKFDIRNFIKIFKYIEYTSIKSYYLDDNLEKVENFKIDNLKDLDEVILRLKELKF